MSKYVDVENINVSDYVTVWECNCSEYGKQEVMAIDDVFYLPAADVAEVKHGKWIKPHWHNSIHCMNCSICGGEAQHVEFRGVAKYYSRCPHCGAKMDLEG